MHKANHNNNLYCILIIFYNWTSSVKPLHLMKWLETLNYVNINSVMSDSNTMVMI